jgi:hypothetical protein
MNVSEGERERGHGENWPGKVNKLRLAKKGLKAAAVRSSQIMDTTRMSAVGSHV